MGLNYYYENLDAWGLNPGWQTKATQLLRLLGEASRPAGGIAAVPRFASVYALAFALQLREITVEHQSGHPKVLGPSVPGTIRLVDLVTG
jgi:hypothetical protein